jgi:hypothetical protein
MSAALAGLTALMASIAAVATSNTLMMWAHLMIAKAKTLLL